MTFKILNHEWEVRFIPENDQVLRTPNGNYNGVCDSQTKTLFVATNEKQKGTLIHELTHAHINELLLYKKEFNAEEVCDFMETYAEHIVELSNSLIKEYTY